MRFRIKFITSGILVVFLGTSVFAENSAPMAGGASVNLTTQLSEVQRVAIDAVSTFQDTISKAKKDSSRINIGLMTSSHKKNELTLKEAKPKATRPPKTPRETSRSNESEGKVGTKITRKNSFRLRNGVIVPSKMATKITKVSNHYYQKAGKPLEITSASRDAKTQSRAMRGLIKRHGLKYVENLYRNKTAVRQILVAYRQNSTNKNKSIKAMAEVIGSQIKRGIYISNHLKSGAFDVSGKTNAKALDSAVKSVGGKYFFEGGNHYHIDLNAG